MDPFSPDLFYELHTYYSRYIIFGNNILPIYWSVLIPGLENNLGSS